MNSHFAYSRTLLLITINSEGHVISSLWWYVCVCDHSFLLDKFNPTYMSQCDRYMGLQRPNSVVHICRGNILFLNSPYLGPPRWTKDNDRGGLIQHQITTIYNSKRYSLNSSLSLCCGIIATFTTTNSLDIYIHSSTHEYWTCRVCVWI